VALAAIGLVAVGPGCKGMKAAAKRVELKSEDDKTLYALGLTMGRSITVFGLSPGDLEIVKMGIGDSVSGDKPEVDLQTYGPKIRELAQSRQAKNAEAEKDKAKAFLEQAAKESGAVKSDSGLVYVELKKGSGATPKASDAVKVHYRGTLTDGTEFDSSYQRNQPVEFPLNQVIPCWTEGVQKMAVGGKAKLVCPSSIAYGDSGRPPAIPGGATLAFEIELLEIRKQ
jgi:FKBP-type peptidyl-prolyl cis-trans isomerase FkpA